MFKSLKGKFTMIYMILVLTIAIVGINSFVRFYSLNKSIDNLMVDNYKSINASNKMYEALDEQNSSLIKYIQFENQDSIDKFHLNSSVFYKWFNIESNNLTEKGESEKVQIINKIYLKYLKLFSQLQKIKIEKGINAALLHYNKEIIPIYNILKSNLTDLSFLNERAMFSSKNSVLMTSESYMYFILILSFIAVLGGLFISKFFIDKYFEPISILTENIKSIREGNLNQQVDITAKNEIGILAQEFNNMTNRLEIYEKSTTGKLLAEKNRFITLVKSIPDPLIVLDSKYKIFLMNKACEDFWEISEEKAIDKYFIQIIRNTDVYDHICNVIDNNSENNQKIISFKSKDVEFFFNVIVTAPKDKNSSIKDIIVVFQNITKLKQLEEIKSNFISTISHEFKTPLNSIILGTSLILDENIGLLNEKQQEIINTIKEDGEKLTSLVVNLLQLTKIQSNKAIFNFNYSSIVGIIDECYKNFYEQFKNIEVNIFYEIEENLPKTYMDGEKISWVINNLLSNSLKFTNAGDQICLSAYVKNHKIYISVKDTGIGIPPSYLNKIFDKFVQVQNSDSESRGTGLGLAIAKEIVDAHNGEIWCESALDMGSTFTFTLPIERQK